MNLIGLFFDNQNDVIGWRERFVDIILITMIQCEEGLDFAGRYNLEKLLGRGGFSEVWLARDILTNVKVAVKIYAPGQGLDEEGVTSFSQEFALVFDMNHTNLLHPTHFDSWEGMPYLILPYCKNGSAFKYISEGKIMPEDECWKLLHDTAAGLTYLHEKEPQPIIHQDIKPDNILINDEGVYMITDFGISTKVRHTLHMTSAKEQSSGTMAYMGPERFSTDPTPIMASDIWSLGAMMYELMTNDTPFGNFGGGMQKNGADIPEIKGDFSQNLKDVVYKCLEKETWNRPSARDIMEYSYNIIHGLSVGSFAETEAEKEARKRAEEEARKRAEEEARKKKEDEAKKKAEKEAKDKNKKTKTGKFGKTLETNTDSQKGGKEPPIPETKNPKKSKTKFYMIIAFIALVVGIIWFCASGGDKQEPVPEIIVVDEDSLKVDGIVAELDAIEYDEIINGIADALMDENNFQNDSIETEIIRVYQQYDNGIKEINATRFTNESSEFIAKRDTLKSRLDDVCKYLESKLDKFREAGLTEESYTKPYIDRLNKIREVIN